MPGLLADSLPDKCGNLPVGSWLARQGRVRRFFSPVRQLCYIGTRGMRALEYRPPEREGSVCSAAGRRPRRRVSVQMSGPSGRPRRRRFRRVASCGNFHGWCSCQGNRGVEPRGK
ncbi:MAG TPA: hypothetical protein ENH00_04155 [Actinobacteria bacterium]|nr:hypothetical protein [Actinomycetota bacterium]